VEATEVAGTKNAFSQNIWLEAFVRSGSYRTIVACKVARAMNRTVARFSHIDASDCNTLKGARLLNPKATALFQTCS